MEYLVMPAIVVICYLFGEMLKLFITNKDNYKIIPVIVGFFGGVLGITLFLINPKEIFDSSNILTAIAIGILSGLSSTGTHQVFKQLFKKKEGE